MRNMRNDIKRFFVAVLAACGLAVSAALAAPSYQAELGVTQKNYYVDEKGGNVSPYAAAATAAPDITDWLQNLGIPLIGRYPDGQITQSTYARNVWDMKYHDGKVFIGSGNSANTGPSPNAGPAEVWEIDPATGAAQLSYKIGGEQADVFRVFSDGCLYVPDHDPPGTSDYNCYYKRDTSGKWSKGGWLTGEVHVYDMAEFDGKMFACGSGNYLWCSDDGGANWYQKKYPHGGRNYAFLPYGDQLMTSQYYNDWNSGDVFRYWNKAQQIWAVPDPISAAMAFPDQSSAVGSNLKLVRPAQFGNMCLYIGARELNDHQNDPFGAYVSTFDGTKFSATAIPAATGQVPWDILVKDGVVYLLVQDKTLLANTDRRYVNRVFASTDPTDATSWTELFSFRATTFAMSFEKVGDTFYFGMGTKDRVCDECGTIYRVNPTASEPPPPALPTAAFASAAQTVQENAGTVSISVVLSQASSSAVSIPFTLGGTALAGADYQIPASPLTIPAGQTSGTIDIVLAADGLAEPAETIIVVLGTPTGAALGATTTHTLTIAASEAPPQADYAAIYVSGVGSDANDGKTVGAPFRTLTKALSVAEDGAVIHVASGWYRPADGLMVTNGVTIVADEGPEKTFLFAPMTTANKAMVTVAHADAVLSGLTVTGKDENENQPEQWGGLYVTAGVVTNCVISHHKTKGNSVNGAGCRLEGGTVVDCTFTNNFCWYSGNSSRGGAVTLEKGDALLDRCTVISNRIWQSSANVNSPGKGDTSNAYGGGVYLKVGTVRNSLVVGNMSLSYGGGIAVEGTGRVLNCTVVGNKARLASGGIWQGGGGTVTNCLCLGNVAHGVVDVADDPGFVDAANGDYRLNPASAAVDAADGAADLGDLDLDGRPRVSGAAADKGCYERQASQTDFGISFRKLTPFAPGAVEFSAKAANGTLSDCRWTFDGGEQKTGATVTCVCEPGSVSVSFRANLDGRPVTVDKPDWFVAYGETVHVVVENENPVFPYATWETAATNLIDAFAAVQRNGTILMGEGTYLLTDERTIDFPMTLRGDKGPEQTVLDAHKELRPFQLRHPSAVLDGLTLRNGRGANGSLGGGVAIRDGGQVTNCVFDACCGDVVAAGGVGVEGRGARILDCRFEGCWVDDDWPNRMRNGVAILTSGNTGGEEDLLIDRCLVRGSHEGCSRGRPWVACGDGAIWLNSGTVRNTIVTGSVLRGCGGILATGSAKVENCTIVGNVSTNENGTVAGLCIRQHYWFQLTAKVYNTIAWDNLWTNGSNSAVKNVGGADDYASRLTSCWTAGDPKLRGHGKFAFRPTSDSPCVDAGSPLSWMDETAVDVYGRPRKQGKGPDIGAAELSSAGLMIQVR